MNYIIITDYYHPIVKSGSIIVGDLANELINNGHNVTLITFVNHDSQEDKISFDGEIKIIRITTIFRKFGRLGRLLAEQSYSNKIIRNLRVFHDIKCDAIICYSPSIFYGKALKWLKNKYNSKAYLIVRDIFPKWALDSGLIKRGLIYNYFKYVEKKLYNAADIIGIETKSDIFYFENYGLPKTIQIEVLSNWGAALDELIDEPDEKILDNKKINIVYGGNIGDAQDLFSLVDSIDYSILDKRAQLVLIGGGNQYNKIKNLIHT
jgi:O26-antigen biosynthesis N-acetyl-L-fucosamine transferase